MLHVLRSFALLLTLSLLTGVVAVDVAARPDGAGVAAHAKFSAAHPGVGTLQVRLGSTHARLITAELEDGPEGEEAPLATFVRSYDGDDQIQTWFELDVAAIGLVAPADVAYRDPPDLSYPAYAGFPTGPPLA